MGISKTDCGQITIFGSGSCVMMSMLSTLQLTIILMAPIYAVNSFVGLLDVNGSEEFFMFLDSIKVCYKALVIDMFMALMYSYLNISMSKNIVPDEIKGREIHHLFPMTLFQPRTVQLDHHNLKLLKHWTLQFVIVRPICSILMIALQILGNYPTWLSWTFAFILNASISLALYSLVLFYRVFAKELASHTPLAKFLCNKGIVFFCFWQRGCEAGEHTRRQEEEWKREPEAELGRLKGDVARLNNVVAGARAEVGRLNGKLQSAKDENSRIKGETNTAKWELDKLEADLQDSQEDVADLEGLLQSSQDEVKRLKDRLVELDKKPSVYMSGEGHADYGVGQLGLMNLEGGQLNIG